MATTMGRQASSRRTTLKSANSSRDARKRNAVLSSTRFFGFAGEDWWYGKYMETTSSLGRESTLFREYLLKNRCFVTAYGPVEALVCPWKHCTWSAEKSGSYICFVFQ
jgi:hypothetical protein